MGGPWEISFAHARFSRSANKMAAGEAIDPLLKKRIDQSFFFVFLYGFDFFAGSRVCNGGK